MAKKVILDTDIGNDIDDTLALSYLLSRRDCDLLGVTTTTGMPLTRAKIADSVVRYFGRGIPVFPGVENPIMTPQRQPLCPQEAALSRRPHGESFPENRAIEFIRETVERYPGEVTLISIGPATNIALLFAAYPHAAQNLYELSQMLGYYKFHAPHISGYTEWNCFCDPYAAQICFQAPLRRHLLFGLDVTMQVALTEKETEEQFDSWAFGPVNDYRDLWFSRKKDRREMIFHDPLAAACVFEEDLCSYETGNVTVDLKGDQFFAATSFQAGGGVRRIAVEVDSAGFFRHFFDVLRHAAPDGEVSRSMAPDKRL